MTSIFDGKVAIVTGARTGMGLETAKEFARKGAAVVLAGRHEPVEEAKKLRDEGFQAISVVCDVAKAQDCKRMVDKAIEEFGRLDFAFNNAGVMTDTVLCTAQMPEEEFDRVVGINLKGVFNCMKYELAVLEKQGEGGSIINCSSYAGHIAIYGRCAYVASKHGVNGLSKSAALEYADKNIRVNALCPGTILTPMVQRMYDENYDDMAAYVQKIPMKRTGTPEEIASLVTYLCEPGSAFITGQCITMDGGYSVQ